MSPRQWIAWCIGGLAVGALVAAVTQNRAWQSPRRPKDMSCHNPFRYGGTVVSPQEDIDLGVDEDQWPALTELLKDFARRRDWDFRDSSVVIPGDVTNIGMSLCAENSLRILVLENHWKTTHAYDHPGKFTPVVLYGGVAPDVWQPVARDLVGDLEVKWPGKVRFVDRDGNIRSDRPRYLDQAGP
jgi:hypothetical protein